MLTAIIFIVVLSVLVLVHELGHFWVAKKAGMKVEEFGFGFPPRLFGIKKNGTVYSINWIPFGGFVKITGEDEQESRKEGYFGSANAAVRALVIVAGVLMNILLALFLLVAVNLTGSRTVVTANGSQTTKDIRIQIVDVSAGSPAQLAGIKPLDEITAISYGAISQSISEVSQVQKIVDENKDKEILLTLERAGREVGISLTPRKNPPAGQGALGISLAKTGFVRYSFIDSLRKGFSDTWSIISATVSGYAGVIKSIFTKGKTGVELSGPVGIAVITGQVARLGLSYLLQFMALISINLAVLNIIPFPALDGGRLLFIIIEKIKGSPVSRRIEGFINTAGFALLIVLMVYVTTRDILKFF